jgi:two-component system, cell cycle response regulator DivK
LKNLSQRHQSRFSADQVQASLYRAPFSRLGIALSTLLLRIVLQPYDFLEQNVDMKLSLHRSDQPAARQPLVLVVDDNEDNLLLLAFVLEQLGCPFITAADGKTALDLAQRCQPTLILLDVMLPDLDGMEVCFRLRQNPLTIDIPVIAVTAMARLEDREKILAAGFNECVTKPYAVDELEVLLCSYIS